MEDSLVRKLSKLEIVIKFKVSEVKLNGVMQDIEEGFKPVKKSDDLNPVRRVGALTKYSDDQRRMVINTQKTVEVMAKELGISRSSVYKYRALWVKKYPQFIEGKLKHKKYKPYKAKFKEQKNSSTQYKVESAVIDD